MILLVTEEELDILSSNQSLCLRIKENTNELITMINVYSPLTTKINEVEVTTKLLDEELSNYKEVNTTDVDIISIRESDEVNPNKLNNYKKTTKEWWELFLSRIPSNIEHGVWNSNNPNTGRRILKSNRQGFNIFKINIVDNDIKPAKMLLAYAYDLYRYRKDSKEENKLQYMLGLDAWLSDVDRIELLYNEACNDSMFLKYYSRDPIRVEQDIEKPYTPFKDKTKDKDYEF